MFTFRFLRDLTGALVVAGLLGYTSPVQAQQDISFGGDARSFAMGGAGIALTQDFGGQRLNPASLAFERRSTDFRFPTFAFRTSEGLGLGRASEFFLNGQGQETRYINDVVRSFGSEDAELGFSGNASIRFGALEIGTYAVGRGRLQPNEALKTFNRNGSVGGVPLDGRADLIAAGYYTLPSVGIGFALPENEGSKSRMAVGTRFKYMNAVYSHSIADVDVLTGQRDAFQAPEMGGRNSLEKRGLGVDVGFMMQPKRFGQGLSAAVTVANLIKPNFTFDGTDRNGNPTRVELIDTTASAGIGFQNRYTTFALDVVDITGATGTAQLRTGAELLLPMNLALRGGYSSAHGFTYGGSVFGFNVAFGERQPLEVMKTLSF